MALILWLRRLRSRRKAESGCFLISVAQPQFPRRTRAKMSQNEAQASLEQMPCTHSDPCNRFCACRDIWLVERLCFTMKRPALF